jgi:hypothetical protein
VRGKALEGYRTYLCSWTVVCTSSAEVVVALSFLLLPPCSDELLLMCGAPRLSPPSFLKRVMVGNETMSLCRANQTHSPQGTIGCGEERAKMVRTKHERRQSARLGCALKAQISIQCDDKVDPRSL